MFGGRGGRIFSRMSSARVETSSEAIDVSGFLGTPKSNPKSLSSQKKPHAIDRDWLYFLSQTCKMGLVYLPTFLVYFRG